MCVTSRPFGCCGEREGALLLTTGLQTPGPGRSTEAEACNLDKDKSTNIWPSLSVVVRACEFTCIP